MGYAIIFGYAQIRGENYGIDYQNPYLRLPRRIFAMTYPTLTI